MKHPDTLWKSSINKCLASSDHECQRPSHRSVVGTAGDSWRDDPCPVPYHRAFSLPGRYEKCVMGSQVTNRVSIVHERPLPYKALQQWLLGAGERGFKGKLLEKIISARAGDGLFLSLQLRVPGTAEPAVRSGGAAMGLRNPDRAAGPGRDGGSVPPRRSAPRRGAGARAPRSPAPPTGACSVNHDGNFSLAS